MAILLLMNFILPIDYVLKVVCSFPCHISYNPTRKMSQSFYQDIAIQRRDENNESYNYISRQLVITWASRWLSATLWRSSRDWLTLFSSWRATCMASSPVPHSSRSGFYKQTACFITFKVSLKCQKETFNFLHFQPIKKVLNFFSMHKIIIIFLSMFINYSVSN